LGKLLMEPGLLHEGIYGHSHGRTSAVLGVLSSLSDDSPMTPLAFFLEENFLKKLVLFLQIKFWKF
jgi:hypothetical protein